MSTERYETGADFFRDNAVTYGTEEALGIGGRYLGTQLQVKQPEEEEWFCRELFAAMFEAAAERTDPTKLVYPYDFQKAGERMEASHYHDSRKRNTECAHAIDEIISASCFNGLFYNLELAAMKAVHDFGFNRVNLVLAHNIQQREADGSFTSANKRWAREFSVGEAFGGAVLNAHSVLIDDFAKYTRKLYDAVGAERFALPGRPESGEAVHGYEIVRAVTFEDQRGFAIGLNPNAANTFVAWQFTVENGRREYYWGHYADEFGDAAQNYIARTLVHMSGNGVKEIPAHLAAVAGYARNARDPLNNTGIGSLPEDRAAPAAGEAAAADSVSVTDPTIADNLSDPSVTRTDMYAYGYSYEGMIPLGKDRALELFDEGRQVFRLYPKDFERMAVSRGDIEIFDGMFGVFDPVKSKEARPASIEVFVLNREQYENGQAVGEWLTLPADADTLRGLLERIGVNKPSEDAFSVTALRLPYDCLSDYVTKYDCLDELNMLASYMQSTEDNMLEMLQPILTSELMNIGKGTTALINLLSPDNLAAFNLVDLKSVEELGSYYAEGKPDGVSISEYGRQIVAAGKGALTDWGYLYCRCDELLPLYTGDVPDKYRIVSEALRGLRPETPERGPEEKPSVIDRIRSAREASGITEDKTARQHKRDKGGPEL